MPELPEVQTIVSALQPLVERRLSGATVRRGDVLHGLRRNLSAFVRGRKIRSITRQAKRIIFDIGPDRCLLIHLGMTGRVSVVQKDDPLLPHTHVRIRLVGSGDELRFVDPRRFGGIWLLEGAVQSDLIGLKPVGPDPLQISLGDFHRLLTRRRQIKALLLDQTALGGIGNIYADESLFRAEIHPWMCASVLSTEQVKGLHRAIRRTLQNAIRAGGSTISDYRTPDGRKGWFQLHHQVYGRMNQPCRRCTTPIQRISAAGRSSHVCPNCQPFPGP